MVARLPLPLDLRVEGLGVTTETARQIINEFRGFYVDVFVHLELTNTGATKNVRATLRETITDIDIDTAEITLQTGIKTQVVLRGHIQRIEQQAQTLIVFDSAVSALDYTLRIARHEMLRG